VSKRSIYDVNLFIESISAKDVQFGRFNCFIPNPEWFREENMPYLSAMDMVLCKTHDAVSAFRPLARETRHVGFTSTDRFDPDIRRSDELLCLHAAGASPSKGTSAVVEAWRRHPEWPRLVVIRSPAWYSGEAVPKEPTAPNIEYVIERLDDRTWRHYQNTCEVHVCPSEAEGFGHIIVEAMSCAAVVITTDGPPMNELVTTDRGVLVSYSRSEPMRLGSSYFVDVDDLERQVVRVLKMGQRERHALGRIARTWYENQTKAFETAMRHLVDEVWPEQIARKSCERTCSPSA
jgi:glycosyltransferase involved in cell wall biosynthesis